nr:hypothetical protein [Koleobacter methoxysyntrophicus]
MEVINNIGKTLGDDLKKTIDKKARLSIAASCFSIYAYEALKKELAQIEELRFIFTSPTFVTDKLKKEKREFYIPKLNREKSLYGTEFEIRLKNELTLKAIAKECSQWIKQKVTFKSNNTSGTLQGFINVENGTLLDIEPNGGTYIYSSSEAFDEEMLIDHERVRNDP